MRRHAPGQYYLVTSRCHQARFFLRPDPEVNQAVREWLARAQETFPDLRILAVCVMSNHIHLIVRDDHSELAAWASYFFGNLSRAVNRLRGRTGACFARRYAAEPILDSEALHDRLVYVVTNPVKAGLCKRARQWPGVVLYAEEERGIELPIEWIDRDAERRVGSRLPRRETGPRTDTVPRVHGRLRIDPLPGMDAASLRDAIEACEGDLADQRRVARRKPLSRARILAQNWHSAPRRPKQSPRPLCHASDASLRKAFAESFRAFVALFREASEQLREGFTQACFPECSYPPGRPLVALVAATLE